jgi:hypothetical protein
MTPEPEKTTAKQLETQPDHRPAEEKLTGTQLAALASPEIQEAYRRAYLLQQARRSCPGCGDDELPL